MGSGVSCLVLNPSSVTVVEWKSFTKNIYFLFSWTYFSTALDVRMTLCLNLVIWKEFLTIKCERKWCITSGSVPWSLFLFFCLDVIFSDDLEKYIFIFGRIVSALFHEWLYGKEFPYPQLTSDGDCCGQWGNVCVCVCVCVCVLGLYITVDIEPYNAS